MTGRCLALAALGLAAAPGTARAATQPVRVGPVTVTVPAGWRLAGPRDASTLTFAIGRDNRATLTLTPPAARSLLPAALPAGGPRRAARLAGRPAWRYGRVTVLPTSAGVLALACDTCAAGVTGLSGAAALAPSPDVAFQLRLPAILGRLDRERVTSRAALQRARTHPAQAAGARTLASAHQRAADALRPLAGPAQRPLVSALLELAAAYDRLARADSAPGYAAARRTVAAAERRAAPLLARAARGYPLRVASGPPPAPGHDGPSVLLLALALAALVAGGVVLRRRPRKPPPAPPQLPPPELMPLRWDAPIA